jgi:hypothetical protein
MENNQEQLKKLLHRLEMLVIDQHKFQKEIHELRNAIRKLQGDTPPPTAQQEAEREIMSSQEEELISDHSDIPDSEKPRKKSISLKKRFNHVIRPGMQTDLEKFVGENLINKIGIIIIVLGVGIGAKYAIDNNLISPLMRIILGYSVGVGLLLFALRLKAGYQNFSAVLLSGAIAIIYFITYAAHSFYGIFHELTAFIIMVLTTIFTVLSAIQYNRQIIALLGLVGAYAVPFLLYPSSDKPDVLFTYVALINIGILVIAVLRYWKALYYAAFAITWLLYISWYVSAANVETYFIPAIIFIAASFLTFYVIFLVYKLIRKEKFDYADILLLLANSFIFYACGYGLITKLYEGTTPLGIFTLINALVHFIAALIVLREKLSDKNLFYFVAGLVLVFVTLAVPIQFDGNWVTFIWLGEALLLFWIGRSGKEYPYELLSAPVMILAFISLLIDWSNGYHFLGTLNEAPEMPVLMNIYFGTSIAAIIAFSAICYLNFKIPASHLKDRKYVIPPLMNVFIPLLLMLVIYLSFRMEIDYYWERLIARSGSIIPSPDSEITDSTGLQHSKVMWGINYSVLFFTILSLANNQFIRSKVLSIFNLLLSGTVVVVVLLLGLYSLSELRSWIWQGEQQILSEAYYFGIRYLSLILLGGLMYISFRALEKFQFGTRSMQIFDVLVHISILFVASAELIHWMEVFDASGSDKLGLSILWGVY